MKKKISHAFRKDIYLLGVNKYGENVWLEAPSWDCDWYWGFGYIETYTNNSNPAKAKDISSHSHWDSQITKNGLSYFSKTTFNKEEGKRLIELFEMFYSLRKQADAAHRSNNQKWQNINKIEIPVVTKEILQILTPNNTNYFIHVYPG